MKIDIWSDIVCPFCYIGRRRLEHALAEFPHSDEVQVVWRSFQLDPTTPRESTESAVDMLMKKYGWPREQVERNHAQLTQQAADLGLEFHFERTRHENTFDAHRLIHFANQHGLQSEMKERLQRAHFTEGLSITDPDTLVSLAADVGLDAEGARTVVASEAFTAEVTQDIQTARQLGINGVPFFVFNDKYAVSGAQPSALFLDVLNRVWAEAHAESEQASA